MHKTLLVMAAAVLTMSSLSGCLDDEPGDDEPGADELGDETQELVSTNLRTITCAENRCDVDLGTSSNRSCVLAGIGGNLQADPSYPPTQRGIALGIVEIDDDHWELRIDARTLGPVEVTTLCVSPAPNQTSLQHWSPGQAPIPLGSGASRKCFLTGLYSEDAFRSPGDNVRVRQLANRSWVLDGSVDVDHRFYAYARCFDATSVGTFSATAAAGATTVSYLADNATGGVACGLTRFGGTFTATSLGTITDGVRIAYDQTAARWYWILHNNKSASSTCIR